MSKRSGSAAARPAREGGGLGAPRRRAARPVFARLAVDTTEEDAGVEVILTLGDRRLFGRAAMSPGGGAPLAVAAATVAAVRPLLPEGVEAELGWLDIVDDLTDGRPRVAHSSVRWTADGEEQIFLGSALASGDPRVAAVRATLDALNRPMAARPRSWSGDR